MKPRRNRPSTRRSPLRRGGTVRAGSAWAAAPSSAEALQKLSTPRRCCCATASADLTDRCSDHRSGHVVEGVLRTRHARQRDPDRQAGDEACLARPPSREARERPSQGSWAQLRRHRAHSSQGVPRLRRGRPARRVPYPNSKTHADRRSHGGHPSVHADFRTSGSTLDRFSRYPR